MIYVKNLWLIYGHSCIAVGKIKSVYFYYCWVLDIKATFNYFSDLNENFHELATNLIINYRLVIN